MDLKDFLEMFPDASVIEVDAGDTVECDLCSEDYTNSPEQGGFLFQSKGVCPKCAPKFEKTVIEHGEQEFIKARCPEGKSFADWIRENFRSAPVDSAPRIMEELWQDYQEKLGNAFEPKEIEALKTYFFCGAGMLSRFIRDMIEQHQPTTEYLDSLASLIIDECNNRMNNLSRDDRT